MVPNGPAGNRPAPSEELTEPSEVSASNRLASSLCSITSRVSSATGGWGKWLLHSASELVSDLGTEAEETRKDIKEICQVIVSDSTAWIRRRTGNFHTDEQYDRFTLGDSTGGSTADGSSRSSGSSSTADVTSSVSSNDTGSNSQVKNHSSSSSSSSCQPSSSDDNAASVDRADVSDMSPLHAQKDNSTEAALEEPNACSLEKTVEPVLPVWRTNPEIKRRFFLIASSDASFTSDPVPSFPSGCANSTQQQQQQHLALADDFCEASQSRNAATCLTEGDKDGGPSEIEIREYMKDSHVAQAKQRLVPGKVTEELFWRRFHCRVRRMLKEEELLSVHLNKLKAPIKAISDSESEEDISWEDLGSDEDETSPGAVF